MLKSSSPSWPTGQGPNPEFCSEQERLVALASYGFDDLQDDEELSAIVRFAAKLCDAPISTVSLIEETRQKYLAREGVEASETARDISFCGQAMMGAEPMIILDAANDPRFADNPLVTGEPSVRFYAGAPLVSREGAPLGALCVIDTKPRPEGLTELQLHGLQVLAQTVMRRLAAERDARDSLRAIEHQYERLRKMAEHIPVLAWSATPDGKIEFANSTLYEFCGVSNPDEITFERLLHPDDAAEFLAHRANAREAEEQWEAKARVLHQGDSYRWLLLRAWPMRDGDGRIENWFGAGVDIDEVHRLSESRDLLARELSHRIKNIFAVVSGLVALRARGRDDVREFADELSSAIRALGTAHEYVRPEMGHDGAGLLSIARDLMKPYERTTGERIEVTGEDVALNPQAATPVALILHELATNAAKYGALSDAEGRVTIEIADDVAKDTVRLVWRETGSGGEAPHEDGHEGFGTKLLRMAVESQLGGKFTREIDEAGLTVELAIPRDRLVA